MGNFIDYLLLRRIAVRKICGIISKRKDNEIRKDM